MKNKNVKVDKGQFEAVVAKLLTTAPIKREDAKTGRPKVGKIIPAKPER